MADLVESGELVVKFGVKRRGGLLLRDLKARADTSRFVKIRQGFPCERQETSRDINAKTTPKRPKQP